MPQYKLLHSFYVLPFGDSRQLQGAHDSLHSSAYGLQATETI